MHSWLAVLVLGLLGEPPADRMRARVLALEEEAKIVAGHGDWLSAADLREQAYLLTQSRDDLVYEIAEAAWKAKDCRRAVAYDHHFLEASSGPIDAEWMLRARARLDEFEREKCPERTPADDAALALTLAGRADRLADEGDVLGAAQQRARAAALDPSRPLLAYAAGVASWTANACDDAIAWFEHFRALPESKAHGEEFEHALVYIDVARLGECPVWTDEGRFQHALRLQQQGEALEHAFDWLGAAGKYERMFQLESAFVLQLSRAAQLLWQAARCADAESDYRAAAAVAPDIFKEDPRLESRRVRAISDVHGCPVGPRGRPAASPIETEHPPTIARDSTVGCSIGELRGCPGALGLLLFALVRRRRER